MFARISGATGKLLTGVRMTRKLSVFIVPEGGRVKQFSISKATLIVIISSFFLYTGLSAVFSIDFFSRQSEGYRVASLVQENAFLATKLKAIGQAIDSLQFQIVDLTEKEKAVRTIFDLPEIDPGQRALGIGGPEMLPNEQLYSPNRLTTFQAEAEIDRLLALSSFERIQFSEIYDQLLSRRNDLDHTPSIQPAEGWVIRGFGIMRDPFTGENRLHAGVDISNKIGTPIYATAAGVVRSAGINGPLGKCVVIDHQNGFQSLYGHLSQFKVRAGARVKRGDEIGLMGSTGASTGPHLHYAVTRNGDPINPRNHILSYEEIP